MAITLNMSGVREWEETTTGATDVVFSYTKKDYRVVKLVVSLLDSAGTVKSSVTLDVSTVQLNTPTILTASLSNGLSRVSLAPTAYVKQTIAAGGTATLTPATGEIWLIRPLGPVTFKDSKGVVWNTQIITPEGVTVSNPSVDPVDIEIFKFSSTSITSYSFTLKFEEKDSAGTTLYTQQSTSFIDYPPITVTGTAGDVTVIQVT